MHPKMSYAAYVQSLLPRYPSLTELAEFLDTTFPQGTFESAISILGFLKDSAVEVLPANNIIKLIEDHLQGSQETVIGLTILLEDPSAVLVEQLGALLDIDPLFFAGHIATFYEPIEKRPLPPLTARYPSQLATKEFIHLHAQRVVDLGESRNASDATKKFVMPGNVPRKVRQIQSLSGRLMGVLRVCTSILYKGLHNGRWIFPQGLILLDSTTRDVISTVTSNLPLWSNPTKFHQVPRRVRIDDFRTMPLYSKHQELNISMLSSPESLIIHLTNILKADPTNMLRPNIFSMAYFPMRLMMAEWTLYTVLMEGYAKFYEYTLDSIYQRPEHTENQDFKELHRWRRSSRQSLKKLQSVEAFVLQWQDKEPQCEKAMFLLQDIRYTIKEIEQHRQSLQTMAAIMTSVIQLTDSRRSIEEALNIRRLTYIALIFIPMSFTASIFSMGDNFGPGKDQFWIYFAAALPLSLGVLALSMIKPEAWNTLVPSWRFRLPRRLHSGKPEV